MARLTETLNLQRGLLRHLSGQPNITLLDSTKVENISSDDIPGGGWPMVQLSKGSVLRARLLVRIPRFMKSTPPNLPSRWALMESTLQFALIPKSILMAGTTIPAPSSPPSSTPHGLSHQTLLHTSGSSQQVPSHSSHSPLRHPRSYGPPHQH